jgi:hypothetical protein
VYKSIIFKTSVHPKKKKGEEQEKISRKIQDEMIHPAEEGTKALNEQKV